MENKPNNGITDKVPAAAYMRMSTEKQKYSLENQLRVISEYSAVNGFELIETFSDAGKSGLDIQGRPGLQEMLELISSGEAAFKVVLVLDVSRWGRFQNADEGAYYEFLCRMSGVAVRYVDEPFQNDDDPFSGVLKGIRRAMAAEYSRTLSNRVFAGQCRAAKVGQVAGGFPGVGLRRAVLGDDGQIKAVLKPGERKPYVGDRVVLTVGPEDEVKLVREIFRLFVNEKMTRLDISRHFAKVGIKTARGMPYSPPAIGRILANERYIGTYTFNKKSKKLRGKQTVNSRDEWIMAEGAFDSIISKDLFDGAQKITFKYGRKNYTQDQLLESLRELYKKHGRVSAALINVEADMPSAPTYSKKFGTLENACRLAGIDHAPSRHRQKTRIIQASAARMNMAAAAHMVAESKCSAVFAEALSRLQVILSQSGIFIDIDSAIQAVRTAGALFYCATSKPICRDNMTTWTVVIPEDFKFDYALVECPLQTGGGKYAIIPLQNISERKITISEQDSASRKWLFSHVGAALLLITNSCGQVGGKVYKAVTDTIDVWT